MQIFRARMCVLLILCTFFQIKETGHLRSILFHVFKLPDN